MKIHDGPHKSRQLPLTALVIAVALSIILAVACSGAEAATSDTFETEGVVRLSLDQEDIDDAFLLIQHSGKLYIPLCSLTEALSLGVTCQDNRAFGFVIQQSRPFVADPQEGYTISGRSVYKTQNVTFVRNGDIFVESSELSRWLPLEFTFHSNTSTLSVHAREVLPIQGFRKRQRASRRSSPPQPKQLPDVTQPRAMASIPTIDFASQILLSGEEYATMQGATVNSLDLSGDLLLMSAEAHLSAENDSLKKLDMSLYRRSDLGFTVGGVPLTQLRLGSSQVPYIDGIGSSTTPMYGVYLSNRAISGATQFLTHDINGYLPQGWDAELFHNGMPIGYQAPTEERMYHFENLRAYYGINDFRVVLHGPFGEVRESQEIFLTDAITPKGNFLYTLSSVWGTGLTESFAPGSHRESQITWTSDFGIAKELTGSALLVRHTDLYGLERDYAGVGLRTAYRYTLLSLDVIGQLSPGDGGNGLLVTGKSSSRDVLGLALELTQRYFWNYDSVQFPRGDDPLVTRSTLRGNSSLTAWKVRIPFSIEIDVDTKRSGTVNETSAWRVSGGWNGWNAAIEADLANTNSVFNAGGIFQVSTRVKDISIRGEAGFSFAPSFSPTTINLNSDKEIGQGFLLNSGITHDTTSHGTEIKAGVSKRYGLVGYSVSATASTKGAYSINAGFRTSVGADGGNHQAIVSAEPLSPSGMVSVLAAVSDPNGTSKPLPGIGFMVNGSRAITVTGSRDGPVIVNLQPDLPVDITVDLSTIEDPFMVPLEEGCRVIPRAGVVSTCRFTMTTGGEIDGMVYARIGQSGEIPLKDVRVDLLREKPGGAELQASTRSQESGYYLFKTVKPGNYRLMIPAAELARLKATSIPPLAVTMPEGGDMVSGKDFYVISTSGEKKDAAAKTQ